jgi:hypothetical protein
VRQAAKEDNITLIDLNAMSKLFYEALDPAHPDPVSKFDIPAEAAADAQRPYGQ